MEFAKTEQVCVIKTNTINLATFEHYFESINNQSDPFFNPDEDILYFNERFEKNEFQVMFAEFDSEIPKGDILNAIKHLKSGKSSGSDHMLNELFTYCKKKR